jgi:probable HAF family extracellular repeat protein
MVHHVRPRVQLLEDRCLLTTITDLGTLGGTDSSAAAINALGQVTGYSPTGMGDIHPFLWQDGQMTDLGILAIYDSFGTGLNNAGQVVGYGLTQDFTYHAFLAADGTVTDLGTLGGMNSSAYGINDAGQIVGYAATAAGASHAFLYQDGSMTDLGTLGNDSDYSQANGINNASQVIGVSSTPASPQRAFLWQDGSMTDLGTLGGNDSYASAINDVGQVAGTSAVDALGTRHAFLYSGGGMIDLGVLTGFSHASFATALNNAGQVVGYSTTQNYDIQHAFLWQDGQMTDLNDLLSSNEGWELTAATGINDQGQIVGMGIHNGFFRGYLLTLDGARGPQAETHAAAITALEATAAPGVNLSNLGDLQMHAPFSGEPTASASIVPAVSAENPTGVAAGSRLNPGHFGLAFSQGEVSNYVPASLDLLGDDVLPIRMS